MRAELKRIQPNEHSSWEDFVTAVRADPKARSGWFSIEVGSDDGLPSGECFQVLICTHDAEAEMKKKTGRSRFVITPEFSPEGIVSALREHLSRVSGKSWLEVRDSLRKSMWWERETIQG